MYIFLTQTPHSYYIKLKFLEPFAMISLISALMSIHKLKLMSKSLQKKFEVRDSLKTFSIHTE